MGVLEAPPRMERLFSKDTVHGIIGNQIYKRTRMYASRGQVISLMGRATMGRDVLTVFPETLWHYLLQIHRPIECCNSWR